ncbi:hypothetical protein OHA25_08730 [Nonomuraea sp. NBC_00507]|uniref:hypothetical protein n=1 Tax=Nonomuraea sp. NBC_00507 TaxID=2976002 RepID=UPI002E171601
MTLVQYLAINRLLIPAGTIAAYIRDGLVDVVVPQGEISPRLVAALTAFSSTLACVLTPRNAPTVEPWCPIVIDRRVDADPEKIIPEITPAGLIVPVPDQLITAQLAQHIGRMGTDLSRYFDAPSWLRNGEPPPSVVARGV